MQRNPTALVAGGALLSAVLLSSFALSQRADIPSQNLPAEATPPPAVVQVAARQTSTAQAAPKATPEPLPISQVVLFNSGMGYFQREGVVQDDAQVALPFQTADINDLLKSLVLEDAGGGKVSAISYDSQDPLDKILRSFALDLNGNPSYGELLQQARGEKIEVTLAATKDNPATTVSGTIVGMEAKLDDTRLMQRYQPAPLPPSPVAHPAMLTTTSHYNTPAQPGIYDCLNLLSTDGLKCIPLHKVQRVRFTNTALENELQRALQVLAQSHDMQKKTVTLAFQGEGKRKVRIGYVVERPIWKMSYRLRLEPNGKLFLQGWALVENTSDADWNNVGMTLVSGRPISYKMDLYQPLYIPRPVVQPELYASLQPQTYGGAIAPIGSPTTNQPYPTTQAPHLTPGMSVPLPELPPTPPGVAASGDASLPKIPPPLAAPPPEVYGAAPPNAEPQGGDLRSIPPPTTEGGWGKSPLGQQTRQQAKEIGSKAAGLNFKEGIASVASAAEVGDYFQYRVAHKVSVSRQKSAMLPIFNETIEGSKVSIYNASVHAKYPLLGLKFKNTSGQPLTQGPVTVFDDSTYAGDTRLLDVQPNEERLLSYALDQGTEVMSSVKYAPSPDMTLGINSDQLSAKYNIHQERTYTIKNRSPQDRVVILEHPISEPWKLLQPTKDVERTREVYRFTVKVPSGKTVDYTVREEQSTVDHVNLGAAAAHALSTGVEVKQIVKASPPELLELKIKQGLLQPKLRLRESKTYYIQNLSKEDRRFSIDYAVRPQWLRIDAKGDQKGPAIHHFTIAVARGKATHQEIVEEHIQTEASYPLEGAAEKQLVELLNHQAPSKAVKAALTQALAQRKQMQTAAHKLAETSQRLKVLSEDQARLRENLKIIPQNSEPYKNFLNKFVARETEIETMQNQVREIQEAHQALQQRYQEFLEKLNAE